MTPFASVAIHEKLALLKIARCRAPALSSTSSASLREVASPVLPATPIRVLVASVTLAIPSPPVTDARSRGKGRRPDATKADSRQRQRTIADSCASVQTSPRTGASLGAAVQACLSKQSYALDLVSSVRYRTK